MKTNKVLIFGVTGSGKTTLARKLSDKLETRSYTTDDFIYKNDWKSRYSEKTRDEKLKTVAKKKKWIIEGTHRDDWILPALKRADLVIIFDLPRRKLFKNLITRQIFQKEQTKRKSGAKDLFLLLKYAHQFKKKNLEIYLDLAKENKKKFIVLENKKQLNEFLEDLK